MNNAQVSPATVSLPTILTANCYFWNPCSSADGRRRCEEKRQSEVAGFFQSKGFEVTRNGNSVNAQGFGLNIDFHYSETCGNVYKSLSVYRNGKKSNITAIRKHFGL